MAEIPVMSEEFALAMRIELRDPLPGNMPRMRWFPSKTNRDKEVLEWDFDDWTVAAVSIPKNYDWRLMPSNFALLIELYNHSSRDQIALELRDHHLLGPKAKEAVSKNHCLPDPRAYCREITTFQYISVDSLQWYPGQQSWCLGMLGSVYCGTPKISPMSQEFSQFITNYNNSLPSVGGISIELDEVITARIKRGLPLPPPERQAGIFLDPKKYRISQEGNCAVVVSSSPQSLALPPKTVKYLRRYRAYTNAPYLLKLNDLVSIELLFLEMSDFHIPL